METQTAAPVTYENVRTLVLARWAGAAFAVVQVAAYRAEPYPPFLEAVAYGLVAALAVANVGFEVWRRRATGLDTLRRLGLVMLATDAVLVSGLVGVYAFDEVSAIFIVLVLLPIEGAVLFGLSGSMWTAGLVGVLYAAREWFGTLYDNPWELESLTFRVGVIVLVALVVGRLVRALEGARRETALALREAQRAEASRSRLVSMLAHDVRAPMAAARTGLSTVRQGWDRIDPAQRDRLLAAGERQVDRALLLARDLLDLARAEAGTLEVDLVPVGLATVVQDAVQLLGDRAEVQLDLHEVTALADPARLEQVLFNLLDNAGKHGRDPIVVTVRRSGSEAEVTVRDHGLGVPDEVELFDAFSGVGEGSVGLGAWIVHQLLEAMDGSVTHHDADPGAAFVIRLPTV